MKLTKIHTDEQAIKAKLAELENKRALIQGVVNDLLELKVGDPTLQDVHALAGNSVKDSTLRGLVARGKSIMASGAVVNINPDNIYLDEKVASALKAKLRLFSDVQFSFYELKDGRVSVVSDARDQIEPGHTLLGTKRAAEVIALVESEVVPAINAALALIRPGQHSAMRDPATWLTWDIETGTFSVDRFTIAQAVQ